VLSVLDALAAPLRTKNEKTYSAPFATRLYAYHVLRHRQGRPGRALPVAEKRAHGLLIGR
jgi:hypothetical protein